MELPVASGFDNDSIKRKKTTFKDVSYDILRYDKSKLTNDNCDTLGMYRSVIYRESKVVCFSPPKSFSLDNFKTRVSPSSIVSIEEYVEGTMLNIFWSGSEWEIATRSSVGGNVSFFENITATETRRGKTFRQMFMDTISYYEADGGFFTALSNMSKTVCFSFVLQHPENKIVAPFSSPSLYLVKTYDISFDGHILEIPNADVSIKFPSWVKYPRRIDTDVSHIDNNIIICLDDYTTVGTMINGIDSITHNTIRTKIRNPSYEKVRRLRGNQPKLQFHYLILRTEGNVAEYLKYYPEHSKMFSIYREQVHSFTKTLHNEYFSCYIKKQKPLKEYSQQYRTHMFKLHELYKNQLSKINKIVNKFVVVNYVNTLPTELLMHSINYQDILAPVAE